jgi:hypothetical protein
LRLNVRADRAPDEEGCDSMDAWNIALLSVASYIAIIALVRLMSARHRQVTGELREQIEIQQRKKRLEAAKSRAA